MSLTLHQGLDVFDAWTGSFTAEKWKDAKRIFQRWGQSRMGLASLVRHLFSICKQWRTKGSFYYTAGNAGSDFSWDG